MAHLVATIPNVVVNVVTNWDSMSYKGSSMEMDEIFWPRCKVCDYIFDFTTMSCLLQLTILCHVFKAIMLFLFTCVHYNYK